MKNVLWLAISILLFSAQSFSQPKDIETEVCIYGATPSGITSAIAASREGREAIIIEPSRWVGGMTGSGLKPIQDAPNKKAIGGIANQFIFSLGVRREIEDPTSRETINYLKSISPADVRKDFLDVLKKHDIQVIYEHRLNSCKVEDGKINEIVLDLAHFDELGCPPALPARENNLRVKADIYIDASYEGELMARAGVLYRTGRESMETYNEEMAGVRPPLNLTPIDPYVEVGNPQSGLLPLIDKDHGKDVGEGDQYTQAYNYRYYVISNPEDRIAFTPPPGYSAADFELVGRYVNYLCDTIDDAKELDKQLSRIFPGWKNAGEYNYSRHQLITMAPVGISHKYADGNYKEKAAVWKYHQNYLRGLHYFMSTDARVPEYFREKTKALGLDIRHHPATKGWPHQLYIRVSRRMEGRYTITAHDVYNKTEVTDSIGLAQYGIDTYPSRRIVTSKDDTTYVALEGGMFIGGNKGPTNVPYPVPYRAITPKKEECENLLVPVCFSASHLGYASARMEPVFMICGESAGIAAAHALEQKTSVQDIDMKRYQARLKEVGQILSWPVD